MVSLQDFISHFPERLHWVKVTTQSPVVCSDYKSPCPLKHDWIRPMPEIHLTTTQWLPGPLQLEFHYHNNICGEFKGIAKNRREVRREKGLDHAQKVSKKMRSITGGEERRGIF